MDRRAQIGWMVLVIAAASWGSVALAQGDPNKTRELYTQCEALMTAQKPCRALVRCEEAVSEMALNKIRALTDQARAACVEEKQERRRQREAKRRCEHGKKRSAATLDHCCWEGQGWADGACVGVPARCPEGYVLDAVASLCAQTPCPKGQHHTDALHCCWPEQVWFEEKQRCLGIPSCPAGLRADGEVCVVSIPDQDLDGIPDQEDECPTVAEDYDQFEDVDGCPEPDNDRDGVCDAIFAGMVQGEGVVGDLECDGADSCPLVAEDLDGFEDGDGCPDEDNDRDGIADRVDLCPDTFGVPSHNGCVPPPDYSLKIAGWTSVGVGAILVGTGTGLLLSTISDREALNNPSVSIDGEEVVLSLTEGEAKALHDSIAEKDTAAGITLGIGGAALVTGAILLVIDALDEEALPAAPTLSLTPDGEGALFLLQRRW